MTHVSMNNRIDRATCRYSELLIAIIAYLTWISTAEVAKFARNPASLMVLFVFQVSFNAIYVV